MNPGSLITFNLILLLSVLIYLSLTKKSLPLIGKQSGGAISTFSDDLKLKLKLNLNTNPADAQSKLKFDYSKYNSTKRAMKYTGKTPNDSVDHASRPAPLSKPVKYQSNILEKNAQTYYMDPKDMNQTQLNKFRLQAKFENMTVKDYTNWLLLFKDEPETLAGFHRGNLRIITRGGKLLMTDLPRVTPVPLSAEHEYNTKISQGILDNVPQPEYLGYLPYNMDFQTGTVENVKNRNLRHLDFVNPDEPLKTWIITHDRSSAKKDLKI